MIVPLTMLSLFTKTTVIAYLAIFATKDTNQSCILVAFCMHGGPVWLEAGAICLATSVAWECDEICLVTQVENSSVWLEASA